MFLTIVPGFTAQPPRPSFQGRWVLSPDETTLSGGGRGDGTGLGRPADELSIEQNDTMLVVAMRREAATDTIRYRLNGKSVENLMPVGRGETVHATYTSRWNRLRLETTISRKIGTRAVRYRELLYQSSDSVLVLEIDVVGSLGGRKAVYRKNDARR
jgi:hypothetical protein